MIIYDVSNSKDLEIEIQNSDEFGHKVITYRSTLNFNFICFHSNVNIASVNNINSVWVCNVTTELKNVKLPKLHINKLLLNQIDFWNFGINFKLIYMLN